MISLSPNELIKANYRNFELAPGALISNLVRTTVKTVRTRLQGEGANSRGRSFNFSLHQLGRQSFVEKKNCWRQFILPECRTRLTPPIRKTQRRHLFFQYFSQC